MRSRNIHHFKKNEKSKNNYITKLFFRIFLSSIILLLLVIFNNANLNNKIKDNINFYKIFTKVNTAFGNIIEIKQNDLVDNLVFFDSINYENGKNNIINYSFEGVTNLKCGIITSIKKNNDETYSISIKAEDEYTNSYNFLTSIDYGIYEYVSTGDILGKSKKENDLFIYQIEITKDGKSYDYYETN